MQAYIKAEITISAGLFAKWYMNVKAPHSLLTFVK
jgi:hypothetical protein